MFAVDHIRRKRTYGDPVKRYLCETCQEAVDRYHSIMSHADPLDSVVILKKNAITGRYDCKIMGDVSGFVAGSIDYELTLLSGYRTVKLKQEVLF